MRRVSVVLNDAQADLVDQLVELGIYGEKGPISIEAAEASGIPIDDKTRAFLVRVAEDAVRLFDGGTPDELAAAIVLYRAHLKLCGYEAEWGMTN